MMTSKILVKIPFKKKIHKKTKVVILAVQKKKGRAKSRRKRIYENRYRIYAI